VSVKEIVAAYLREHGYDGLYFDECGCRVDDLMPCGECCSRCLPGYLVRCDEMLDGLCIGPKEGDE